MKNINHTRSSISDDIRNILCSSANMKIGRAVQQECPRPISYAVFCLKKKRTQDASVLSLTPLCILKTEGQSTHLASLKTDTSWNRTASRTKAGSAPHTASQCSSSLSLD